MDSASGTQRWRLTGSSAAILRPKRAAAAVSLRNRKTPPDFAARWRAAKLDPDDQVRAQAYQTLDRFGQLRTADDLLAASRSQTDAGSTGRFLRSWLEAGKVSEEKAAETLVRLADHTGSAEASGALSEISKTLQSPTETLVTLAVRPSAPPLPGGLSQPAGASRSADRADLRIDPELRRGLDDAQAPRRPQRYNLFIVVDALPYIVVMIGVLAFALLAGWALQNLP